MRNPKMLFNVGGTQTGRFSSTDATRIPPPPADHCISCPAWLLCQGSNGMGLGRFNVEACKRCLAIALVSVRSDCDQRIPLPSKCQLYVHHYAVCPTCSMKRKELINERRRKDRELRKKRMLKLYRSPSMRVRRSRQRQL